MQTYECSVEHSSLSHMLINAIHHADDMECQIPDSWIIRTLCVYLWNRPWSCTMPQERWQLNYRDHCCYSCSWWPQLPGPHLCCGLMRTKYEEILYYCYVKTDSDRDLLGLTAPSSYCRHCLSCQAAETLNKNARFNTFSNTIIHYQRNKTRNIFLT
jgi:hypothetical protein